MTCGSQRGARLLSTGHASIRRRNEIARAKLMSNYFDEVDHRRLLAEYPIGQPFLEGPVRLSRDALHALQERRFLAVVARGWEVPFYRRRWQAAGLEPGDIRA